SFAAGGLKGPLDWYRCVDRNWALTAWLQDRKITAPALFMVGEHDPVRLYAGAQEAALGDLLEDLRGTHVLPGAGHWLQQERPDEVNARLIAFLDGLALDAAATYDGLLAGGLFDDLASHPPRRGHDRRAGRRGRGAGPERRLGGPAERGRPVDPHRLPHRRDRCGDGQPR